jgi:2'-5' RNA ligase
MSGGASVRLFVAVDPPPHVGDELIAWTHEAVMALDPDGRGRGRGAVRILEASSLHLTLCFLGSRPAEETDALAAALERSARPVEELSIGPPVLLPPRNPRALAVEVLDGEGELADLHGRVAGELAAVSGWEPERRRLRPHITVARMREDVVRGRRSSVPMALPATPRLRFAPASLVLYRSWLDPAGARYEALAEAELPLPGR